MKRAIFISYRRDDAEGEAGRLFDDLVRAFGDDSVFMDVAGIAPGTDFRKAIDENVACCGVFLAVIGPEWTNVADANGSRRLEDENDFVRLEVASALARNIAVIPVLVHDARMPHPEQLPDNIKDLAFRNSVEISHERWNSDVQLLIQALNQYVTATRATAREPIHATIPVQLPPLSPPYPLPAKTKSKLPLILGLSFGGLFLLGMIGYFADQGKNTPDVQSSAANPPTAQSPSTTETTPTTAAAATAPAAAVPTPSTSPAVNETQPSGNEAPNGNAAAGFAGAWKNPYPAQGTDALVGLRISASGNVLTVEPWGDCRPNGCSWGMQNIPFNGTEAAGIWTLRNVPEEVAHRRETRITLCPSGEYLNVRIQNTWWNQMGEMQRNQNEFQFVRAE